MKVVINDLSFTYAFHAKDAAIYNLETFVEICREIESGDLSNVSKIISQTIDFTFEIAPDCKIVQLAQCLELDERRYLFSLFVNRDYIDCLSNEPFILDDKKSYICSWAKDGILISLVSSKRFAEKELAGLIGENEVVIKNIADKSHIKYYYDILGKRIYKAHSVKHKTNKENPYGKGKIGSPMDLTDDDAQTLLNKAILVKGKFYAKSNEKYYAFQNEQDIIYHGYIANNLGDDIKTELDKHIWS